MMLACILRSKQKVSLSRQWILVLLLSTKNNPQWPVRQHRVTSGRVLTMLFILENVSRFRCSKPLPLLKWDHGFVWFRYTPCTAFMEWGMRLTCLVSYLYLPGQFGSSRVMLAVLWAYRGMHWGFVTRNCQSSSCCWSEHSCTCVTLHSVLVLTNLQIQKLSATLHSCCFCHPELRTISIQSQCSLAP